MPVDLWAEWVDPSESDVNVNPDLKVIALYMDYREPDEGSMWHSQPEWALVIRQRWMGSQVTPSIQSDVEVVKVWRIRFK